MQARMTRNAYSGGGGGGGIRADARWSEQMH